MACDHTEGVDTDGYCTGCGILTLDPVDHPDFEKEPFEGDLKDWKTGER